MPDRHKRIRARCAPILALALVVFLIAYVGAYFAMSRTHLTVGGPDGEEFGRGFPNRQSLMAFMPLWQLESFFRRGFIAYYPLD